MRKRVLILPIIMVVCLIATIYVANTSSQATQSTQSTQGVEVKMPEKIMEAPKMKYPVSVEQAKAAAVTSTPTPEPTPTPDPTPEPTPEPVIEEVVVEEVVEEVYDSCFDEPVETGNYYEDLPDESSEVWQYEEPGTQETGMQYVGVYYITHYSAEACGNAIGAAEVPCGLVEGTSIAVPESWMLGHLFYIENYGTFRADDLSDGPFDIFHWYTADAIGADYQNVWLVS